MGQMAAAEFKAHCLEVMERVRRTRQPVVITKRGVPVAKLVPADPPRKKEVFGCLEGEFEIVGDLTRPLYTAEEWADLDRQSEAQWRRWDTTSSKRRASAGVRASRRRARRRP